MSALLRSFAGAFAPRPDVPATSREMALGAATLYAPAGLLVLFSLLLPHPGASVPLLGFLAAIALLVAVGLTMAGARLPYRAYPLVVTLGIGLITAGILAGGPGGVALACFFIWSGMYAWYFLRTADALVQTALMVGVCVIGGSTGRASPLFVMMIVGTLLSVCLWLRASLRNVRALAVTDHLTGVANRRGWDAALRSAIEASRRGNSPLCVAMVDLDHFKVFNDEHGHISGDLLLRGAVQLWQAQLRSDDLIARYGGEEFAILFRGCALDEAGELVDRLRRAIPRGQTCSAGVALWDGKESAEALLLRADAALYGAKHAGRDRHVLAGPLTGRERASTTTLWSRIVLDMLRDGVVGAAYQPVVRLADRTILGYEALARPSGTDTGRGVENLFVAAQRMGLTREIDYLCRRAALERARHLSPTVPLFLNISVAALLDPEHDPDQMLFLIRLVGRQPHSIVLEISERESITDPLRFAAAVRSYREHGFGFAIDDVGDGHSTFETLAATVPEYLKLTAHFIRRINEPGPRAAIIAACSFAVASDAAVIAEGIEDEASVAALRALGVELGQGFHLGHPAILDAADDAGAEAVPLPAAIGGWN